MDAGRYSAPFSRGFYLRGREDAGRGNSYRIGLIVSLPVGVIPCAVQREAVRRRHGSLKGAGVRNDPG